MASFTPQSNAVHVFASTSSVTHNSSGLVLLRVLLVITWPFCFKTHWHIVLPTFLVRLKHLPKTSLVRDFANIFPKVNPFIPSILVNISSITYLSKSFQVRILTLQCTHIINEESHYCGSTFVCIAP